MELLNDGEVEAALWYSSVEDRQQEIVDLADIEFAAAAAAAGKPT